MSNKTVQWQDEANRDLRAVLTAALGHEPKHDIQFNRHAIQKNGLGAGKVVLWAIESSKGTGGARYGKTTRGLIEVASQIAALSQEERFFCSTENSTATMVALHVSVDLLDSGAKGVVRQGLARNPDATMKQRMADAGVAPVMKVRNANGSKAMIGAEWIDPKDPRCAASVKLFTTLCGRYEGLMGEDAQGEPLTASDVCSDVIRRDREVKTRNAEKSAERKADKAAKRVKMPAMKAHEALVASLLKTAKEQGVNIEDPAALGEFVCGAVVLAYADTELRMNRALEASVRADQKVA